MSGTLGNRAYFQNAEIQKSNLGGSSSDIDISSYYGTYVSNAIPNPLPGAKPVYIRLTLKEDVIGTETATDINFNNITSPYGEHPYSRLTNNYLLRPNVMNSDSPSYIDNQTKLGKFINSLLSVYLQPNGNLSAQYQYTGLDVAETTNPIYSELLSPLGWSALPGVVFSPLYLFTKQ
jgi:hypothetical protein